MAPRQDLPLRVEQAAPDADALPGIASSEAEKAAVPAPDADAHAAFAPTARALFEAKPPPRRPGAPQSAPAADRADESDTAVSRHALAEAAPPRARPANLRALAERVRARRSAPVAASQPAPSPAASPATVKTVRVPTSASVQRAATQTAALELNTLRVIGIFGSQSSRRALLRKADGNFQRVSVGDTVDGWRVTAISDASVRLARGSDVRTKKVGG
ncbi:MAG: type IV pilus biogenesis protein PilP [Pseudomonadota bacterium]